MAGLFQYMTAELLWLRCLLSVLPPAALHFHPDAAITSIVGLAEISTNLHPSRLSGPPLIAVPLTKTLARLLASLARSANATLKLNNTTVGLLNTPRSLTSKEHLIQDLLSDCKLDFICLTET